MPILTAARFSFERPFGPEPGSVRRVRAAWISDVHLGTRGANASALLDFLRKYEFETLYVVGDLIDIWQLRRGIYWPQQHNDVVQKSCASRAKEHASFTSRGITTICSPNFMGPMVISPCRSMPFIVWRTDAGCSLFTGTSSTPWCKT